MPPSSSSLELGAKRGRVALEHGFPEQPALEDTTLPLCTRSGTCTCRRRRHCRRRLHIEPIEDAAKRIAQLRSIGELECHELISKGSVNWIALEELLAVARDAERNRALVFCRWLANHQPLARAGGGDLAMRRCGSCPESWREPWASAKTCLRGRESARPSIPRSRSAPARPLPKSQLLGRLNQELARISPLQSHLRSPTGNGGPGISIKRSRAAVFGEMLHSRRDWLKRSSMPYREARPA